MTGSGAEPGSPLATLHLFGVHGTGVARAVGRMALDRLLLPGTEGLRFHKLLGTGDGRTFTVRDADPHRWGLFCVWDGAEHVTRFEDRSRAYRGWSSIADETWRADLAPLRWKGAWSRRDPFEGLVPATPGPGDAPVAALTRARIRPSRWRSFWSAVPQVAVAAGEAPGRRFAIGIGEAPVGLQATFSVWDSADALERFAYRGEAHRDVIRRTHTSGWYAEEMFVRFSITSTSGTVDGRAV